MICRWQNVKSGNLNDHDDLASVTMAKTLSIANAHGKVFLPLVINLAIHRKLRFLQQIRKQIIPTREHANEHGFDQTMGG